jgi:predicted 2-oxoglutarate/Fe(II)-dependent dioxygenase YbiX
MIENQYHIVRNALPHDLCDHLVVESFVYNKAETAKVREGKDNFHTDPMVRNTEVVFHPCKSDLGKFFKQNARTANKQANWFFNINRIETIQILKYQPSSFYNRHIDLSVPTGKGYHQKQRKISCSLQLNEPNEYTGGELALLDIRSKENDIHELHLNKGDLLLFPSFIPHSILPIGDGVRYSATAWIEGLSFR